MTNNNYDFQRNMALNNISHSIDNVARSVDDQTYLQAYGKEAYIEMIEKRRFRNLLFGCGIGAFIVGYTIVGLALNNWNINVVINKTVEFFMNLF